MADLAAARRPSSGRRGDWPIVGIGVAVAGVVRRVDGLVSMAPNLGWVDVPLGSRLARALAIAVPISIVNDADAGVLGEYRRGRGRSASTTCSTSRARSASAAA